MAEEEIDILFDYKGATHSTLCKSIEHQLRSFGECIVWTRRASEMDYENVDRVEEINVEEINEVKNLF